MDLIDSGDEITLDKQFTIWFLQTTCLHIRGVCSTCSIFSHRLSSYQETIFRLINFLTHSVTGLGNLFNFKGFPRHAALSP